MTKHRPRQFTPKASKLWTAIPVEFQEKFLAKVFCSQCGIGVAITNYKGAVKYGNIILRGSCAICGHEVVRLQKVIYPFVDIRAHIFASSGTNCIYGNVLWKRP